MKLTESQKQTLRILRKYPTDIVMDDGWLTGGHGVKLNLKTVQALKDKKLINSWGEYRDRISELGKSIDLDEPKEVPSPVQSKEGFTSGIWEVDTDLNGGYYQLMNERSVIANIFNERAEYGISKKEAAANARLIAESKNMYEALKSIGGMLEDKKIRGKRMTSHEWEIYATVFELLNRITNKG